MNWIWNSARLRFQDWGIRFTCANDESMWYGPCLNRTRANTVKARGIWYTAYDIMHIRIIDSDINSFNRIRKKINRLISSRVFSRQLNPIIVGFSQTIDFESSPRSWIFMTKISYIISRQLVTDRIHIFQHYKIPFCHQYHVIHINILGVWLLDSNNTDKPCLQALETRCSKQRMNLGLIGWSQTHSDWLIGPLV